MKPINPATGKTQETTAAAVDAYSAHVALLGLEMANPALAENPYWIALREAAFARFRAALEAA